MMAFGAVMEKLSLRRRAEVANAALPALLLEAETLANAALPGGHGQRRAGGGEDFWQYRPVVDGDGSDKIDWRRSARTDVIFTRETEAMTAAQAALWVDDAPSMHWRSKQGGAGKVDRARLLALALGLAFLRSGERVCVLGEVARSGREQAATIGGDLFRSGALEAGLLRSGQQVFLVSDWLGPDLDDLARFLAEAAAQGVKGAVLQILDPAECSFPFEGAVEFTGMDGRILHETADAEGLREAYRQRLGERRSALEGLAGSAGWRFASHHCDEAPAPALKWAAGALGRL